MKIRKVKNSAGNYSVQIGEYKDSKFILHKHIGSAKNDDELSDLIKQAHDYINRNRLNCLNRFKSLTQKD